MNAESIAALIAAGVAIVGIPTTIIVGRWQYRGALRAAEATARAGIEQAQTAARVGIAQAESSYRAALDAVRATGSESHAQWLRGVRREAYTAFLLACNDLKITSDRYSDDTAAGRVPPDLRDAEEARIEAAMDTLESRSLIVELEGPEAIGDLAKATALSLRVASAAARRRGQLIGAWFDLRQLARDWEDGRAAALVNAIEDLRSVTSSLGPDGRSVPRDQRDEATREAESEVVEALRRLDPDQLRLGRTCIDYGWRADERAFDEWLHHTESFEDLSRLLILRVRDMLSAPADVFTGRTPDRGP
ncbi:hypothetical protein [Streptomyces sp. NPDC004763]